MCHCTMMSKRYTKCKYYALTLKSVLKMMSGLGIKAWQPSHLGKSKIIIIWSCWISVLNEGKHRKVLNLTIILWMFFRHFPRQVCCSFWLYWCWLPSRPLPVEPIGTIIAKVITNVARKDATKDQDGSMACANHNYGVHKTHAFVNKSIQWNETYCSSCLILVC